MNYLHKILFLSGFVFMNVSEINAANANAEKPTLPFLKQIEDRNLDVASDDAPRYKEREPTLHAVERPLGASQARKPTRKPFAPDADENVDSANSYDARMASERRAQQEAVNAEVAKESNRVTLHTIERPLGAPQTRKPMRKPFAPSPEDDFWSDDSDKATAPIRDFGNEPSRDILSAAEQRPIDMPPPYVVEEENASRKIAPNPSAMNMHSALANAALARRGNLKPTLRDEDPALPRAEERASAVNPFAAAAVNARSGLRSTGKILP